MLTKHVFRVFNASNRIFGYRKVHARLADEGTDMCDGVVRELMAEQSLQPCHRAPWRHDRAEPVMRRLFESREYASTNSWLCLRTNGGIRSSMGNVGCWFDNAPAESFFASLKKELVHRTQFPKRHRDIDAVVNYIEIFYNHQRPHQTLHYATPAEPVGAEYSVVGADQGKRRRG